MANDTATRILASRRTLIDALPAELRSTQRAATAAEGGCGVLGVASRTPIAGRHVLSAAGQMHNRGNGKGGGIAMAGLDPAQARVDADTLRTHTLYQIALLDRSARADVEQQFIAPYFDIAQGYKLPGRDDWRSVEGLEVEPPEVWRYFVRARSDALAQFVEERGLEGLSPRQAEDEFVYQNSFRLNTALYASLGEQRAFVLSHGRDLSVLKIVGYAEQVVETYQLEDQTARIWIAHQRYPTKGRVWHPGGAHPFIGLNEALVHNGDFANYHAVCEYLRQRNVVPLFLTDTEVAALLFDVWDRVYDYPLEATLEAMAPTTEHDFTMLPAEKQELYRAIQATHMHASPDGPWFFILARTRPDEGRHELLGITDTSMLRPQVFALYENDGSDDPVQIGLIGSERQAINACLRSLAGEDTRFQPVADRYWVARGGSHTDGGAFLFSVSEEEGLTCTNKFGEAVTVEPGREHAPVQASGAKAASAFQSAWNSDLQMAFNDGGAPTFHPLAIGHLLSGSWRDLTWGLDGLRDFARHGDAEWHFTVQALTLLLDRPGDVGHKKPASVRALIDRTLTAIFDATPALGEAPNAEPTSVRRLSWETRGALCPPAEKEVTLLVDALGFPPDGETSAARLLADAVGLGWQRLIATNMRGSRFAGCGLGPDSDDVHLHLYGDVGDYAASGLDGAEVHIHGAGQDQLGQILRRGKLVIHGDVGQTFLYGAKGGEIYVRGSAAGRPLINAVGKPRAVINGTCLDYLAESFMAGDPFNGGGFVILNGIEVGPRGELVELESPYPGGNLFSLASGGAIYIRDPRHVVQGGQLNGGAFDDVTEADWALIEPYLRENERLFGIRVDDLLTVDGERRSPEEVYRRVAVKETSRVLAETQNH